MGTSRGPGAPSSFVFETFGVRLRVTGDAPEVIERLPAVLPPDARPCPDAEAEFSVLTDGNGGYRFERAGLPASTGLKLEDALALLEVQLQIFVGLRAPNRIFVHAGVVAHDGRAIVIPGRSFVGKSMLVLALVRAGADYYSDEFAVIDERGLVHPYATPLGLRDGNYWRRFDLARFHERQNGEPLPIGAVLVTAYREGTEWKPTRLSPGRAVLAMLDHALSAMQRPQETTRFIARAVQGAVVLEGERGEADDVARQLLDTVFADMPEAPLEREC